MKKILFLLLGTVIGIGISYALIKTNVINLCENSNNTNTSDNSTCESKVVLKSISSDNCLNCNDINYEFNFGDSSFVGINTGYNSVTQKIMITVDWSNYSYYGESGTNEYEITNIDGNKVVDILHGVFGHGYDGALILFLMNDGTVEYMPLLHALEHKDFKSYGKFEDVTDIINIKSVSMRNVDSPIGYGSSVLAIRSDGTFYNLPGYKIAGKYE